MPGLPAATRPEPRPSPVITAVGEEIGDRLPRGFARPISEGSAVQLFQLFALLVIAAGAGGVGAWLAARSQAAHPLALILDSGGALVAGALMMAVARRSHSLLHRRQGVIFWGLWLSAGPAIAVGEWSIGPRSIVASIMFVWLPIFSVFILRLSYAIWSFIAMDLLFTMVVFSDEGYSFPLVQVMFFVIVLTATGAIIGGLMRSSVEENNRLSRLRRFLPPQVAEAVLASGASSLLDPHRRKIAVLFCDLRGFTRFSSLSEPEEVVEVLDEYFRTVGTLLHEQGATLGSFAGDGIMAYFGDPVRSEDPAQEAIDLAFALSGPMGLLVDSWARRGFRLTYGVGISYGYATLGVVGFEGRHDYTALGSVVNLAARLSDRASGGEILVDERTAETISRGPAGERCVLELKGFEDPVPAYRFVT